MLRNKINIKDWQIKPYHLWEEQWLLLTSGDFQTQQFNMMTVGWGSFGSMWSKPFALIAVRPQRHTFEFTEKFDSFTLSAFPEPYHGTLNILGNKSGREMDKINQSGLTPIASETVSSPGFTEAELIVECKKMYWQDLDPEHFLTRHIHLMYAQRDYHRIYYGEILSVSGTDKYRAAA